MSPQAEKPIQKAIIDDSDDFTWKSKLLITEGEAFSNVFDTCN